MLINVILNNTTNTHFADSIINKCGAVGGMRISRENQSTGRKPAPVSFW
jgi:hypothetical protein